MTKNSTENRKRGKTYKKIFLIGTILVIIDNFSFLIVIFIL